MRRFSPVIVLALLLTACGGGGAQRYTLKATNACLEAHQIPFGGNLDFVASTATGGALKAVLPDNSVTIAFGQTASDADNIYQAYVRFHASNVGVYDVLRQDHNAVLLWHYHPSDQDAQTIGSCLKS